MKFTKLVAAAAALWLSGEAALAQQVLRFGHVGEPGSLFAQSAEKFAEIANARLGDKAQVQVFGASQLGSDREMLQKLKLGQMTFSLPSSVMSSVSPEFGVFEMPYIIQDRAHISAVSAEMLDSVFNPAAEREGYHILAVWENGFRHITNNVRPIQTPADLSGVKLRIPGGEWRAKMFQSYGANPTPMSFSDVFTALQTGVIDGQENPYTQIASAKFQ
ncbi:TRAP transporter substrate-binding protein, partial [Rubrimonas sp.]|uniref:TRAP transporter substrate-binding protein n=1 Tax=Rubrimonas sp. TaxID=2036015 RepID=UPI002FDEA757